MEFNWRFLGVSLLIYTGTLLLSLIGVTLVLISLPSTYFLDRAVRQLPIDRHPLLQWLLRIGKNLLGVVLIIAGLLLSLPGIPGQGVLTCLIGVLLLDFPGKRRWERQLVALPRVYTAINRLRERFGRPPLLLPDDLRPSPS